MSTVIDSFVIELGLDPTKFNKGQQQAFDAAKKMEAQQLASAKNVETAFERSGEAVGQFKAMSLSAFAAITGSAGLLQFAAQAVHAGAAAGRMSRSVGASVETITKFQAVASVFGGSAEGMANSFVHLSDTFANWKIGVESPLVADLRAISTAGGKVIDVAGNVDQAFKDLAENLRNINAKDPAVAGALARRIGLDPGLFDSMIQKGEKFNDILARMRGLTDAEAEAAGKTERAWNNLVTNTTNALRGFVLDQTQKTIDDLNDPKTILGMAFGPKKGEAPFPSIVSSAQASTGGGAFASQADKEAFIRSEAAKRGINPNVAMAVARSEGFLNPVGDNGTSFGAFQLHVTPGARGKAVGDQFRAATGRDPSDPANERAGISFALDDALKNGWTAYHGAARSGIGQWQGIPQGGGSSSVTTIQNMTVVAPSSSNPTAWAKSFQDAVQKHNFAAQANGGQS